MKKKEIDDQKVKNFEMELFKKRTEELNMEKQKIAQKKAEDKEVDAIKELEIAKQNEEKELEKAKAELEQAKAKQHANVKPILKNLVKDLKLQPKSTSAE
jgi:hypothetical protein